MLLIYTPKISSRIKYVFSIVLKRLAGIEYLLCDNEDELLKHSGPVITYGETPKADFPFIASGSLLNERGIREYELKVQISGSSPLIFQTYNKKSILPFDPFAASFYILVRYEEYLPHITDKYNRFDTKESLAWKNGFLEKPIVNIWAEMLAKKIREIYPEIKQAEKKYKFIPTYDIDAAWAYKHKGLLRTLGGFYKAISKLDFKEAGERIRVLSGKEKDPFDTYDFQLSLQEKYNIKPIYFILFADYGVNDKNTPTNHDRFHELIKMLSDYAEIGIHPSYTSNRLPEKLKEEVYALGRVINKEIMHSRQHFLKLTLPATYRNLINLDISNDYSMGFASAPGFRAGICDPYPFYDLETETETKLMIHPFTVMDGTLKDYLGYSPEQATEKIKQLIDEVKAVKGTFISLWHNESLCDCQRWENWKEVYINLIKYALPDKTQA